jgi:hypothetical protein
MKTFEGSIQDCDIVFTFNRISMRKQERVMELLESFQSVVSSDRKRGFSLIREAVAMCVSGWSKDTPLSDIDDELDLKQMVQVVNQALSGNSLSEDERKKSE